ncbi:hypothetical protein NS115_20465 [Paenibacillus jamilae]|uniref:Uncharacterized protein n=1 Tax=Paenibacillus jamilae TaxID=114136 RepID=A0ACC4ZQN4_9BACL|nr:hypothetical protein NS115_20465 [Paenibacillus jamilae]
MEVSYDKGIARGLIVFLLAAIFSFKAFMLNRQQSTNKQQPDILLYVRLTEIEPKKTERSHLRAIRPKKDMTVMNGQWQCVQKVAQMLI